MMQYPAYDFNNNDQNWREFCDLLAGLNEKTPLGRMVMIRSEDDEEILKTFSRDMLEERARWRSSHMTNAPAMNDKELQEAQTKLFAALQGLGAQ